MGPFLLLKNTADGHEWVSCVSKEELPIALNGTTVFTERCSQSSFLLLQDTSGGQWSQMGPLFFLRMLLMHLHGHALVAERYCQCNHQ